MRVMSKYLDTKELETLLLNSIDQRYEVQANRDPGDYIFSNYLFQSLSPAFVEFSYQNRHAIADYLSDEQRLVALVDYCGKIGLSLITDAAGGGQ